MAYRVNYNTWSANHQTDGSATKKAAEGLPFLWLADYLTLNTKQRHTIEALLFHNVTQTFQRFNLNLANSLTG